ncbi:MAG: class I SAM-dependent methyltransferase [Caulobacterales bacterium]|nr:class I SAM-dependent methyltransferase [Caulobacterales bacterium]
MADVHAHEAELAAARRTDKGFVCPACNDGVMEVFYEVPAIPTNSCILLDSEGEAKGFPTGEMKLGFCPSCGFIFNTAFDITKTEYSGRYEETQAYSGTFNKFHTALAERLISKHDLRDKDVMEIGCGKGEFLMLLAELGGNRGVGVDPGVHVDRISGAAAERMKFIPDFYSEKYADHKVDFLACKMTLEHIPEAEDFISTVRRGLGDQHDAVVFFQIPEALRILRVCAFEDVYWEHCAYFSPGSLARLFRRAGFDVTDLDIEYGEQYLTIEARPRAPGAAPNAELPLEDDLEELRSLVASFPQRCGAKLTEWRERLDAAKDAGKKVVLWGSGSKAVSFLTTLGLDGHIEYVTDINPYRHDHYMPKTGQRIVDPKWLAEYKPDLVVVMNAIYEDEIRKDLADMGLSPEVVSL